MVNLLERQGKDLMTRDSKKLGFTLTEMLVVITILAVLMTLVLKVGKRLKDQSDEIAAKSTIDILVAAIEEYQSHHDRFPVVTNDPRQWIPPRVSYPRIDIYQELQLGDDIAYELKGNVVSWPPAKVATLGNYYYSSEGLYYFLSRDADCVATMKSIPEKYVTNLNENGVAVFVDVDFEGKAPKTIELRRFIDPWGNSYRYIYRYGYSFPIIESAGKDGDFLTVADNISSR